MNVNLFINRVEEAEGGVGPTPGDGFLLLEIGDFLLLETSDKIILE
jgi:hypothetical protein